MNKEKTQDSEKNEKQANGADVATLQKELAEWKDKYVRLFAEFDNARKRQERERVEFIKYANEGVISEFLDVLDNLERTVEAAQAKHEDYDAFLKGVEMVMGSIKELLKRNDVKAIKSVGEKFDPHCHEILALADSDDHKEGTVLEEFQKGYILGDKVIRTAKVKVVKPKESEETAEQFEKEQPPK